MKRAQAATDHRAQGHMETLASLQQQSIELGRVVLIGSAQHKPQPTVSPVLLLQQLERLKQQKSVLEIRIRAGEISADDFPSKNLTKEFMTEAIASLEKDIEKLKVAHQNKSLVLRRIQLYDAIHRKLLEKDPESKLIHETIEHSRNLCRQILKSHKKTLTLEKKLIAVRKKRLELKETSTAVMAELKAAKESADSNRTQMESEELKNLNKLIAQEIDTVTVVQNVFQRIILSSQVNWAEDPKLKNLVLTLGVNPVLI
ncbi:centromere protein H [Dendropsophus ebraccatus]|uniref:centromere protein H n=1 Tax=Dendropsophus ebraccatus TaxID=150705 RepID=UPI0038322AB4